MENLSLLAAEWMLAYNVIFFVSSYFAYLYELKNEFAWMTFYLCNMLVCTTWSILKRISRFRQASAYFGWVYLVMQVPWITLIMKNRAYFELYSDGARDMLVNLFGMSIKVCFINFVDFKLTLFFLCLVMPVAEMYLLNEFKTIVDED